MYRHLQLRVFVFVVLVSSSLLSVGCSEVCTVKAIEDIQPNANFRSETLDGLWFVSHVYDAVSESGGDYSSYTVHVLPTKIGLTLYTSRKSKGVTSCEHTAIELSSSSHPERFSTAGTPSENARTVVVGAVDDTSKHVLIYVCHGDVKDQQLCTRAMALVAGRQPNVTRADNWLKSVTASLPCFASASPVVVQQADSTQECSKEFSLRLAGRNCTVNSARDVQDNFDLAKYASGKWYEISWFIPPHINASDDFEDFTHAYRLQPNGSVTAILSGRRTDGTCFAVQRLLQPTTTPGSMLLYEDGGSTDHIPYNVVETDYDHYSVVIGCQTVTSSGVCQSGRAWIWSRDQTLDRQYLVKANSRLQDVCVNPASFTLNPKNKECETSGSSTFHHSLIVLLAAILAWVFVTKT